MSDNPYRRYTVQAFATTNFFLFRREFVKVLKLRHLEALFLQDLINLASMDQTQKDDQDYFLCSVEYLEDSLDWSRSSQTYLIQKLCGKRFLKSKLVGMHTKRWLWVDTDKIAEGLDWNTRTKTCRVLAQKPVAKNSSSSLRSSEPNKQKKPPPSHSRGSGVSLWDESFARRLFNIVQSKNGILLSKRYLPNWSNQFRLLRESLQDDTNRIDKVLDWYENQERGKQYTIIADCGQSFRKKFIKMEEKTKWKKLAPSNVNLDVEATPQVRKIADDLQDLGWGKDSKDFLQFVNTTYQIYLDFQKRLKSYIAKRIKETGASRDEDYLPLQINGKSIPSDLAFADSIHRNAIDLSSFVRGWIRETHEIYQDDKWRGRLLRLVPNINKERFEKFLEESIHQNLSDNPRWSGLKERLYAD